MEMKACNQNELQTIYDHGMSVMDHLQELLEYIHNDKPLGLQWNIPEWLIQYKDQIKSKLLPTPILLEYALFHDCGKPRCLVIDADGKRHFPNHAAVSASYWLDNGGDPDIAKLISMDMDIHTLKNEGIADFCNKPECISLLLTGLAEVHSNSLMFGGCNSTSFKIKFKQISKRGKAICKLLFKDRIL